MTLRSPLLERARVIRRELAKLRRGATVPGNAISAPQLDSDDVFLVSYPRSGNTWLRVIIAELLYQDRSIGSLAELNRLVPDIHIAVPIHGEYSSPRVIKTHMPYTMRHEADRRDLYRKIIYCVRHPIDAIASYYDLQVGVGWLDANHVSFERFVDMVLNYGERYGSWQQHVLSWLQFASERDFHLVRYEDLRANPTDQIKLVAQFLGSRTDEATIEEVAQRSNRERMIALERAGALVGPGYEFIRRTEHRPRAAAALTPELKAKIIERCREGLLACGYPVDGQDKEPIVL